MSKLPPPKNGSRYVGLLAGGPADIFRELTNRLNERSVVSLKHHLDYHKPREWDAPIPKDVDLVIILKDMMGHSNEGQIVSRAKSVGVPFIRTQRKSSRLLNALAYYGLVEREGIRPVVNEAVGTSLKAPTLLPSKVEEFSEVAPEPVPTTPDEASIAQQILDELGSQDGQVLAAAKVLARLLPQVGLRKITVFATGKILIRSAN